MNHNDLLEQNRKYPVADEGSQHLMYWYNQIRFYSLFILWAVFYFIHAIKGTSDASWVAMLYGMLTVQFSASVIKNAKLKNGKLTIILNCIATVACLCLFVFYFRKFLISV